MKRTAYNYSLVKSARLKGQTIEWIRIWYKKAARGYKYRFYPVILTYSNKAGYFLEKRFKTFRELRQYLRRFDEIAYFPVN